MMPESTAEASASDRTLTKWAQSPGLHPQRGEKRAGIHLNSKLNSPVQHSCHTNSLRATSDPSVAPRAFCEETPVLCGSSLLFPPSLMITEDAPWGRLPGRTKALCQWSMDMNIKMI